MGLAVEFEGLLSYGGLFSQPSILSEANAWLACEERRLGILRQTAARAEGHNQHPHQAALEDCERRVAWLKTLQNDLKEHNERIAPMKFSWIDFAMEPVKLLLTGKYK